MKFLPNFFSPRTPGLGVLNNRANTVSGNPRGVPGSGTEVSTPDTFSPNVGDEEFSYVGTGASTVPQPAVISSTTTVCFGDQQPWVNSGGFLGIEDVLITDAVTSRTQDIPTAAPIQIQDTLQSFRLNGSTPNRYRLEMYETGGYGKLSKLTRIFHKINMIPESTINDESFTLKDTVKELLSELTLGKVKGPGRKELQIKNMPVAQPYVLSGTSLTVPIAVIVGSVVTGSAIAASVAFSSLALAVSLATISVFRGLYNAAIDTYKCVDISRLRGDSIPKTVGKAVAVALITFPVKTLQTAIKLPIKLVTLAVKLVKLPFKLLSRYTHRP